MAARTVSQAAAVPCAPLRLLPSSQQLLAAGLRQARPACVAYYHRRLFCCASTAPRPPGAAGDAPPSASSPEPPRKRLAVFVSGGGSNFRAIHAAILEGRIAGEVAVVVSNAPSCGGAAYAATHGIPTLTYPAPKGNPEGGLTADQLVHALAKEYAVDFVLLAGYLKLIPAALVRAFPRAVLNIHPALLPAFGGPGYYGRKVHEAVIASGARLSGPSIHFVDEEYDSGPILAQAAVPVYPTDRPETLAARVLKEEHKLYPECVAALCDGRVTWRHDGIPIIWHAR